MNTQQREAVEAPKGYVQIVAGPGTGKTFTLVERIVACLQSVKPEHCIVMTFTNAAAREIREKVAKREPERAKNIIFGTYHGVALLLLRRAGCTLGVADESDSRQVLKELGELKFGEALGKISRYRMGSSSSSGRTKTLAQKYERRLNALGLMDFDGILLQFLEHLRSSGPPQWVEAVFIDEFQDTCPTQLEIALELAKASGNLTVVGDPDQSIYSFRNANPLNFLLMRQKVVNSRVVKLETNYRSTGGILNQANEVIRGNPGREELCLRPVAKLNIPPQIVECNSVEEEARKVSRQVNALLALGVKPEEIAILARTLYGLRAIEMQLAIASVPVRICGGRRLAEKADVRAIIDFLRVAVDPGDSLAILRTLNVPKRGIGEATLKNIFGDDPMKNAHLDSIRDAAVSSNLRIKLDDYLAFIEGIDLLNLKEAIESIGNRTDAKDETIRILQMSFDQCIFDPNSELSQAAQFVGMWVLVAAEVSYSRSCVTLSTIHSAKGLEWPVVFAVNCSPSRYAVSSEDHADERRLLYVAITRAKFFLSMSFNGEQGKSPYIECDKYRKDFGVIDEKPLSLLLGRSLSPPSEMTAFTSVSDLVSQGKLTTQPPKRPATATAPTKKRMKQMKIA